MWSKLRALQRDRTVRYGVPMLLLVVGGSFGLREFAQIRYDDQKYRRRLDPALEAVVTGHKQPFSLEQEYENMKQLDIDKWRNVRGPRPWEASRETQERQREQRQKGP
ncbi:hypothetical protein GN956_G5651 [Arapaima gigas]